MATRLGGYLVHLKMSLLRPRDDEMTSHDVIIASKFLNGGHLGPPSWTSGSKVELKGMKTHKIIQRLKQILQEICFEF